MIYCVGDCHASFFSGFEELVEPWPKGHLGKLPYFRCARIERVSVANELMEKIDKVLKVIEGLGITESDSLMLVYGEPDCRRDIPRYLTENPKADYHETITYFADKYIECIEFLSKRYNMMIFGVWGQGVNPRNSYMTQVDRNKIVVEFNKRIEAYCKENDIPFISIYEETVKDGITKDGWLKKDLHIHLSQTAMPTVIEKFKERGLI